MGGSACVATRLIPILSIAPMQECHVNLTGMRDRVKELLQL